MGSELEQQARRKKPYLLWGFLIGVGILAATIDRLSWIALVFAVVTGLIGMLIGYGIYRWRCRIS